MGARADQQIVPLHGLDRTDGAAVRIGDLRPRRDRLSNCRCREARTERAVKTVIKRIETSPCWESVDIRIFGDRLLNESSSARVSRSRDNGNEVGGRQACAPDQSAVHVANAEDFGRVGAFDRASIENAHLLAGRSKSLEQLVADCSVHFRDFGIVGILPVPMAQMGSYATASSASPSRLSGNEPSSWAVTVLTAAPASRTSRVSPTHRMALRPTDSAAVAFAFTRHRFLAERRAARNGRRSSARHPRRAASAPMYSRCERPSPRHGRPGRRWENQAPHAPHARSGSRGRITPRPLADTAVLRTRSPRPRCKSDESPCIFQLPATSFFSAIVLPLVRTAP